MGVQFTTDTLHRLRYVCLHPERCQTMARLTLDPEVTEDWLGEYLGLEHVRNFSTVLRLTTDEATDVLLGLVQQSARGMLRVHLDVYLQSVFDTGHVVDMDWLAHAYRKAQPVQGMLALLGVDAPMHVPPESFTLEKSWDYYTSHPLRKQFWPFLYAYHLTAALVGTCRQLAQLTPSYTPPAWLRRELNGCRRAMQYGHEMPSPTQPP